MRRAVFFVAIPPLSLLLIGCASVDYVHQDGGRIMNSAMRSEAHLQQMADDACAEVGKNARLGESGTSWEGHYRRFHCIDPTQ